MKYGAEITRQVITISYHFRWRRAHYDEATQREPIFHMDAKLKIIENMKTNTCINFHREWICDL